jgi:hypothetical protein
MHVPLFYYTSLAPALRKTQLPTTLSLDTSNPLTHRISPASITASITAIMNSQSRRARALVTHRPINGKVNWKLENVTVPSIQDDELLVRVIASGICHTDIGFSLRVDSFGIFPRVLGHEGSSLLRMVWKQELNSNRCGLC